MPWYEAESDCTKKGGHLVVISSAAENDVVYGIVGGENRKTWIGLSNYAQVGDSKLKEAFLASIIILKKFENHSIQGWPLYAMDNIRIELSVG